MKENTLRNTTSMIPVKKVNTARPKQIYALHDHSFKACLKNTVIARDFFEIYLPKEIKDYCDLETLVISDTEYVEAGHRKKRSDVLYRVKTRDNGYLYFLIEHVSKAKVSTHMQLLGYQVATLMQHISQLHAKEGLNTATPLVVPIIFYRGRQTPYPYSTNIADHLQPLWLAKQLFSCTMLLVDVSSIPDDVLKKHKSVALLELVQKHAHMRRRGSGWLAQLRGWLIEDQLYKQMPPLCFESMVEYMCDISPPELMQEVIETIKQTDTEREYLKTMQTMTQHLRQEGKLEGKLEGRSEATHTIAKNMMLRGFPASTIAEMTGLRQGALKELEEDLL